MMPIVRVSLSRRRLHRRKLRGMTLPELMVTVTIVGVLAAIATSSYSKQVSLAHSAEAVEMLGNIKNAVSVSSLDVDQGGGLDFSVNSFGKGNGNGNGNGNDDSASTDVDGDGNNGHGDSDGCDPSNPSGKCKDRPKDDATDTSDTTDPTDDGNNGHGNDDGKCDPSNPGKSGKDCKESTTGDSDDGDDSSTGEGDDLSSGGGGSTLTGGDGGVERLCGSAVPVPSSIDLVTAKQHNPEPSAWETGDEETGWRCLRVSRSGNQTYQFGYDVGAGTLTDSTEGYTAWARGDLDGDGRISLFRLRGELVGGKIVHAPGIEIIDQTE